MLFIFALPVMQVILFCLAIGRDPTGLKVAVANMEMNGTASLPNLIYVHTLYNIIFIYYKQTECHYEKGCHLDKKSLSCRYLDHLNDSIEKEYYASPELAIQAVKDGNAWGAIYFTDNFTDALVARMALGKFNHIIYQECVLIQPYKIYSMHIQVARLMTKRLTNRKYVSGLICPTSKLAFYLTVIYS